MTTPATGSEVDLGGQYDNAACLKMFTDTMERLNDIAEQQMQSILELAIAAADAANSIDPANDQGAKFVQQVTEALDEMKTKIETPTTTPHDASPGDATTATADPFCRTVENDIAMALVNSVTFQQQLNTIGAAVLTEGAKLVLTAGGESSGG